MSDAKTAGEKDRTIRYAVVGLGWIAQEVVLPGFRNAKSAQLTALVTGDPRKARELGKTYGVEHTCDYTGYDELLRSGNIDAVYIALPNSLHKEFTVRAANAGIHILCEKPMAGNAAECLEMVAAAKQNDVRLMIAYRLHFESANLSAIEAIQNGEIGEPRIFDSVFSQQVAPGNIRLKKNLDGGPLMDMGVYPINAVRYLFRDEPVEVPGTGYSSPDGRFSEVHETASAILRFPGNKIATLTCSFGAAPSDSYRVVGTKGELLLEAAYDYHEELGLRLKINGKTTEKTFKVRDQFGPELEYFARCILDGKEPEPSGQEGLADIRIVQAIIESMRTGQTVRMAPFHKQVYASKELEFTEPAIKFAKVVHADSPSYGGH